MTELQFAWHVHHDMLAEPLHEPIEKRRRYIKELKPADEQALRLRLLKHVKGTLPEAYVTAWNACVDAQKAYLKAEEACVVAEKSCVDKPRVDAGKAYTEAWKAYDTALKAFAEAKIASMPAILSLHNQECPNCPWNGKTIFSER